MMTMTRVVGGAKRGKGAKEGEVRVVRKRAGRRGDEPVPT